MVSVIIPSRNIPSWIFLQKTIDSILENSVGKIEIIVILDGYIPTFLKENSKVIVIQRNKVYGMRRGVNDAVAIANGKYIMKCDDHCMFGQRFDEILKKDIEHNWLVVPVRYTLTDQWIIKRQYVAYEYAAYPYKNSLCIGLYTKKWLGEHGDDPINSGFNQFYFRERQRKDILIDEIMIIQGSCWFTTKQHFMNIRGLFDYESMYQEPQEMSLKTWLSGGKVIVNKNTWYGHLYKSDKPRAEGHHRGYELVVKDMRNIERYGTWYWMNDQWPLATKKIKWFIEHFWPIPGWPENWEEEKKKYEEKYNICYL